MLGVRGYIIDIEVILSVRFPEKLYLGDNWTRHNFVADILYFSSHVSLQRNAWLPLILYDSNHHFAIQCCSMLLVSVRKQGDLINVTFASS